MLKVAKFGGSSVVIVEHIPSKIDSFDVVVETKVVKPFVYELMRKLKKSYFSWRAYFGN